MIRAMIASGIVPRAIAGRIMCRIASTRPAHWAVISGAERVDAREEVEDRPRKARRGLQAPDLDERNHLDPGAQPAGGGSEKNVSFNDEAKRNWSISPSTNTGVETPRFATTIVPTSTWSCAGIAEMIPSGTPTTIANIRAQIVSSTVVGSRSMRTR